MKKLIFTFSLFVIFLTTVFPSAGSAIEMSAGVYTWYSWWDLAEDENCKSELDPEPLYGPALSVGFTNDLSLTFVFLYGKFDVKETDYSEYYASGGTEPIEYYNYEMNRIDSDIALNYKLNSYLKIYLGAKYTSYSYEMGADDNSVGMTAEIDFAVFGPGAGISVTLPLGNNFYFIGNLGGFYLWGEEERSFSVSGTEKSDCKNYGLNTGISVAYYIEPASTTISLGGRYQHIKTWVEGSEGESDQKDTEKFYGITLSATYSFSI